MLRRRPRRRDIQHLLDRVALTQPAEFQALHVAAGLHQHLTLAPLDATPAGMALESIGVHTAAELLALLRGVAGVAAVNSLAYSLGLFDTTADDVLSTTVIVSDETVPLPT